eukprot:2901308-Prymnesium_polylepis.1
MRAWVVRLCASLRHGSCVGDTLDHNPCGCAAAGQARCVSSSYTIRLFYIRAALAASRPVPVRGPSCPGSTGMV